MTLCREIDGNSREARSTSRWPTWFGWPTRNVLRNLLPGNSGTRIAPFSAAPRLSPVWYEADRDAVH
jgi:hypothetical protein